MRTDINEMIKELKGEECFREQMCLAQRRLDMYRQDIEKSQQSEVLKNGTGIITAEEAERLTQDVVCPASPSYNFRKII